VPSVPKKQDILKCDANDWLSVVFITQWCHETLLTCVLYAAAAWVALACVLLFNVFYAIGLGPIAFVAMGEIVPLENRGFFGAAATSANCISSFLVVKTFPFLVVSNKVVRASQDSTTLQDIESVQW